MKILVISLLIAQIMSVFVILHYREGTYHYKTRFELYKDEVIDLRKRVDRLADDLRSEKRLTENLNGLVSLASKDIEDCYANGPNPLGKYVGSDR